MISELFVFFLFIVLPYLEDAEKLEAKRLEEKKRIKFPWNHKRKKGPFPRRIMSLLPSPSVFISHIHRHYFCLSFCLCPCRVARGRQSQEPEGLTGEMETKREKESSNPTETWNPVYTFLLPPLTAVQGLELRVFGESKYFGCLESHGKLMHLRCCERSNTDPWREFLYKTRCCSKAHYDYYGSCYNFYTVTAVWATGVRKAIPVLLFFSGREW